MITVHYRITMFIYQANTKARKERQDLDGAKAKHLWFLRAYRQHIACVPAPCSDIIEALVAISV